MAFHTYAFRIGREAGLLNDEEWEQISPLLENRTRRIVRYRRQTGLSLEAAKKNEPFGRAALDRYEALTGIRLDQPELLWGLRMRDYGALCPSCSRPFRTPRAKMCAECGYRLPDGMIAGQIEE